MTAVCDSTRRWPRLCEWAPTACSWSRYAMASTPRGDDAYQELRIASYDNPLLLYGNVRKALLLDHMESDLRRMKVINALLKSGEAAFGNEFLTRINAAVQETRG